MNEPTQQGGFSHIVHRINAALDPLPVRTQAFYLVGTTIAVGYISPWVSCAWFVLLIALRRMYFSGHFGPVAPRPTPPTPPEKGGKTP